MKISASICRLLAFVSCVVCLSRCLSVYALQLRLLKFLCKCHHFPIRCRRKQKWVVLKHSVYSPCTSVAVYPVTTYVRYMYIHVSTCSPWCGRLGSCAPISTCTHLVDEYEWSHCGWQATLLGRRIYHTQDDDADAAADRTYCCFRHCPMKRNAVYLYTLCAITKRAYKCRLVTNSTFLRLYVIERRRRISQVTAAY